MFLLRDIVGNVGGTELNGGGCMSRWRNIIQSFLRTNLQLY